MGQHSADRVALASLGAALRDARAAQDARPALLVVASTLAELGVTMPASTPSRTLVADRRDAWLDRLRSAGRSDSTLRAYRNAIDDLIAWAQRGECERDLFDEATIVAHLDDYRRTRSPAPNTYHRRFLLLRCYLRWLSRREGLPDPFLELQVPPRSREEREWLTPEEFARMVDAALHPPRRVRGLAERDRLVLITLVTTGLRRSELLALDWRDLHLEGPRPSLLVRRGKGGKPRRQPLAPQLAAELEVIRCACSAEPNDPVFRGLAGRRLQAGILADIVRRTAKRARIEKCVSAHTLRHTAATWLRQSIADTRLVAEYLGHADVGTVARYAHVAAEEMHVAASTLATVAGLWAEPREPFDASRPRERPQLRL